MLGVALILREVDGPPLPHFFPLSLFSHYLALGVEAVVEEPSRAG